MTAAREPASIPGIHQKPESERGIILVTVIWTLLVLTVIAWTYARQCQMEIRMTGFQTNSIKALYLARAGAARAMVYLREDKLKDMGVLGEDDLIEVDDKDENYQYDAPSEAWGYNPEAYGLNPGGRKKEEGARIEDVRGTFTVKVEDLSGRINVNAINYITMRRLLEV
ncbi:MAG: general secretion pathway protein GspK, partial [Candidatus Omnitrophica bacterium]|nr:general secretion pathway protein GspK [Candidatus Omnitrophota bacterium]